jgi:hypothetical protein
MEKTIPARQRRYWVIVITWENNTVVKDCD